MAALKEALEGDELESVYDHLAHAIDEVGTARIQLFLVKLALLNAQALGDAPSVRRLIRVAMKDL